MSQTLTLQGNLAAKPELKMTGTGKAVTSFTIVTSTRSKNEQTQQWESKDVTYWNCSAWGELAENICSSLDKGDKVIAFGKAASVSWDDKQTGQKRNRIDVTCYSVGPDLNKVTVNVKRVERSASVQSVGNNDPWAAPVDNVWGQRQPIPNDIPPF